MKKHVSTIVFILLFLIGLSLLLYPTVSNYINEKNSSRVISLYDSTVEQASHSETTEWMKQAENYNETLYHTPSAFYNPSLISGYYDALDITGTGIMGYIYIEKLKVQIPIYHGSSDLVMQVGVGHIEGTSLPVGGESTHCVLTAHNGLPSSKLFTDLEQMELGDSFVITVLDRMLTYEVDQIHVVYPDEFEDMLIEPDKDYCTLLTCVPYGINTHRLLVRGVRTSNPVEEMVIFVPNEAFRVDTIVVASVLSVPFLILLFVTAIILYKKQSKQQKERMLQRVKEENDGNEEA